MNAVKTLATSACLALAVGCGGPARPAAFAEDWQSDGGKAIAEVIARLGAAKATEGPGVALGITRRGLVGVPLGGGRRWTHVATPDHRPVIAGDLVVFTARGALVALDARTGAQVWSVPVGQRRLRGAGAEGGTVVASLSGSGHGTLLLAVSRSGGITQRWEAGPDVGAPGLLGGVAFAPWGNQYVSALDVATGEELGRVLGRVVMSRVVASDGALWFGETAFARLDPAIRDGATAHVVRLPSKELPGKPTWSTSGLDALPREAGAGDSIRFLARPVASGDGVALDGGRFAAVYFGMVLGFGAPDAALRWVRPLPAEILGGDAAPGGFALCDAAGKVWLVDGKTGGDAGSASLGEPLVACVVQGGSHRISGGESLPPLAEQLAAAVALRDTQLGSIQRVLVRELAADEKDPSVTSALIGLASDPRTPPEILDEARALLAKRTAGTDHMLEALARHYDFLSDVDRPPPVGPLADALAAAGDRRAAPLLAAHLNDPADTPDDVARAARALVALATPDEVPAVRSFFALYRATAGDDSIVAAVIDSARVLVAQGGAEGRSFVERAAGDPLTHPAVKAGIASLAAPEAAEGGGAPGGAAPAGAPTPRDERPAAGAGSAGG